MKKNKYSSVHYSNYLQIDKILGAQDPISDKIGKPAHDEMLFIIVHQVYELWFKELMHDIGSVMTMFQEDDIDEKNIGVAVKRLNRVIEIMKLLVQQVNVIETITPLDFLDFRNYLLPASGFQSFQFRKTEVLLGLKVERRTTYGQKDYRSPFTEEQQAELTALEEGDSMLQLVEKWLERIPFLEFEGFDFLKEYQGAIQNMIESEKTAIEATDMIEDSHKAFRLQMLEANRTFFESVFDQKIHDKLIEDGQLKISYKSTMAALLINLYRDEPILQLPYQLLTCFVEIDELLTNWRSRHAQMVMRMLGRKMGTGGSSGHDYLKKTAEKHHIFNDLSSIATLLIPRSELPILPEELKKQLGFHFTTKK